MPTLPIDPPDSPAAAGKRHRWFPGWTMLGFSALGQFMSGPGQSYSVAAFKEPMRTTLGITETDYSVAYGVATIVSGLSLPITGKLVDRYGARRVMPIVACLLALGCGLLARTKSLGMLYAGFTLIRCMGQGALTLVALWIVGEWFLIRRGFATALSGLGSSLSVMTFPLVNGYLISVYGWEQAWLILAVVVVVSLVGPVALGLRDRPEPLGLSPDGLDINVHRPEASPSEGTARAEDSWAVAEVMRDACFWRLLLVPIASGMIGTGLVFHQVSLFATRGVGASAALGLISAQAFIATIAALGAGWLTDRWPIPSMMSAAMLLLAAAVATMMWMPHPAFAALFALLMGLHGSILRSAGTVVWVNYYGRQNQGAIRGITLSAMVLAAAVGPMPFALARDYLGSYNAALWVFLVFPLVAAALVITAPAPRRRSENSSLDPP